MNNNHVQLDPQIQAILDQMASAPTPSAPPTLEETRTASSTNTAALAPTASDMAAITDIQIDGPNGPVRCIVNRPSNEEGLPVFVYFHGGGCVLLRADDVNSVCTNIAEQAQCIVVNVDYRLAPEHPFPQPLEDAKAVYLWCVENAAQLGGDPKRIAIGGDSAGGYLATSVCLEAKAAGLAQPVLQVLVYPQVDMADRSASMISVDAFLNETMVAGLVEAHVGDAVLDPRASPLRAADHSGLAPAFILAAGHDPLVDQGLAYAAVLRRAEVPVEYSCYEGAIHAFFTFGAAVEVANTAVSEVATKLNEAF